MLCLEYRIVASLQRLIYLLSCGLTTLYSLPLYTPITHAKPPTQTLKSASQLPVRGARQLPAASETLVTPACRAESITCTMVSVRESGCG